VEVVLLAAAGAAALLALWIAANRRHLRRRSGASPEWSDAQERPDLWTSAARCPSCGRSGGVLSIGEEPGAEGLWFTCLHCRQRHRREGKA
jgi:hypothetical protein